MKMDIDNFKDDYEKVYRVVQSCTNSYQFSVALNLIKLFEKKYPRHLHFTTMLRGRCEAAALYVGYERES